MHTDPAQEAFEDWVARPGQPTLLALLRAHQDRVFNLCMQVLRHHQDAEDAAQDCLLKIVDGVRGFKEADQFGKWTTRVAINSALDALRRNRARAEAAKRKAESMTHAETATSADVEALYEALGKMDEDSRALVVEHDLQKTTLQEMGRRLGVGAAGVLKRLRGAREELRRALCASGMAACVPRLDLFLDGVSPVAAPLGLIGAEIISRVAAVSALGAGSATVGTMGAVAMSSTKTVSLVTIAAATLLGLGAGWTGVTAVHSRKEPLNEALPVVAQVSESEDEARLRKALAAARATLAQLQQEHAAEALRSRSTPTDPASLSPEQVRAEIAKTLGVAYDQEWLWNDEDERFQSLLFKLVSLIHDEAERNHLTMAEMADGPDGTAAIALEALRSAVPPPDPAALALLDGALAKMREDWKEYLGHREGLTMLARTRDLDRMRVALDSTAFASLDEDSHDRWTAASSLWGNVYQVQRVSFQEGMAETDVLAREAMSHWWVQDLQLDDNQKVALRPIVDEFQRAFNALEDDAILKGTGPSRESILDLTIEAQKKMAATLDLSPSQAKALQEMTFVPTVSVRMP